MNRKEKKLKNAFCLKIKKTSEKCYYFYIEVENFRRNLKEI